MKKLIKSPIGMCFYPHLWETDKFNPLKEVFSCTLTLDEDKYQQYIQDIKNCLDILNVKDEHEDYVLMDRFKLYRKTPRHPNNSSGKYQVKATMRAELEIPEGNKKQKPFIVNSKGEGLDYNTDLSGSMIRVHSKPTKFKNVSVISNVLKGVVVYQVKNNAKQRTLN